MSHPLTPFAPNTEFTITFCVPCRFTIQGPIDTIIMPLHQRSPLRRDNLWKHTCLELFIHPPASRAYTELNITPSGHYNLYRFDDYRTGQTPLSIATPPTITSHVTPTVATFDITLPALAPPVALGPAVILEHLDNTLSYWALSHPSTSPDFHLGDLHTIVWK
jgi:hypothetical protein